MARSNGSTLLKIPPYNAARSALHVMSQTVEVA